MSDAGTRPGGWLDLSQKSVATKIGGEYCRQSGQKTSITATWTRSLCVMIHQKLGCRVFCVYELWAHLRKTDISRSRIGIWDRNGTSIGNDNATEAKGLAKCVFWGRLSSRRLANAQSTAKRIQRTTATEIPKCTRATDFCWKL